MTSRLLIVKGRPTDEERQAVEAAIAIIAMRAANRRHPGAQPGTGYQAPNSWTAVHQTTWRQSP